MSRGNFNRSGIPIWGMRKRIGKVQIQLFGGLGLVFRVFQNKAYPVKKNDAELMCENNHFSAGKVS